MSHKTYTSLSTKQTPQNQPILGENQIINSAGGYVFQIDSWKKLLRFLIIGSEGGTYYISEQKLVRDSATNVLKCINENGKRVVDTVISVSQSGRAPKNDPALFVLAMCAGLGDLETRKYALQSLPKVARIGTHLFHFVEYIKLFRGWGRSLRKAIGQWYLSKEVNNLAFQIAKYQQRDGWSHRDLLRLSHPSSKIESVNAIFKWITNKETCDLFKTDSNLSILNAVEMMKIVDSTEAPKIVSDFKLPLEMIPTHLRTKEVLNVVLQNLGLTALIRNLGMLSSNNLLDENSNNAIYVIDKLTNKEALLHARVHPIAILSALLTYQSGHGFRGKLTWTPNPQIIDALDEAFYLSFNNVNPTNKRLLVALDISGSMGWHGINGLPFLTPIMAETALASISAKLEPNVQFVGFSHSLVNLDISKKRRLDDLVKYVMSFGMGSTDCSLPMIYAIKHNLKIDSFIVYTDNETWFGDIHPVQALRTYRQKSGINAKLIVVGMTSTDFSIADQNDGGMLDVVGFDTATPNIISDFILNKF